MWAWIGVALVGGFLLLRNERTAFRARTVAALHGEQSLLRGLVDSGRKVLAAMLLILPGDRQRPGRAAAARAADQRRPTDRSGRGGPQRFDAIDGDWRRVD